MKTDANRPWRKNHLWTALALRRGYARPGRRSRCQAGTGGALDRLRRQAAQDGSRPRLLADALGRCHLVRPRALRQAHRLRAGCCARDPIGVAHSSLPCGTTVKFVYHGRSIVTQVIDRGPYSHGNSWDLTRPLRKPCGFDQAGAGQVGYAVALERRAQDVPRERRHALTAATPVSLSRSAAGISQERSEGMSRSSQERRDSSGRLALPPRSRLVSGAVAESAQLPHHGRSRQHRDDPGPLLPGAALPGGRQRHRLPGQHGAGKPAFPGAQKRQDQGVDADPGRSRPASSAPSSTASSAPRPRRAWRSCAASRGPSRPATACAVRARSRCSAHTSARRSSSAPT